MASASEMVEHDLIVRRDHDPCDPEQPPIHVALAAAAELSRSTQMVLVGGIGSGKTVELLLTQEVLSRHRDAVNIFIDLADYTDLNELNTGAVLAIVGLQLFSMQKGKEKELPREVVLAHKELHKLALGTTTWVPEEEIDGQGEESTAVRVISPGLIRLKSPALEDRVKEVKELLLSIASPLLQNDAQITLLIDGLDRLIYAERFREYAEQDLQALRRTKMTVIIVAPLLLWYDKSRFLDDHFDLVKHMPATDPSDSAFLERILERRGALDLMDQAEVSNVAKFSGGVLRDLLTLARSAAEYAYRDDQDRIGQKHVRAAIRQLGNRYLAGLGTISMFRLRKLINRREFSVEDSTSRAMLVKRQVLEHFRGGRKSFVVHPALAEVLPKPK